MHGFIPSTENIIWLIKFMFASSHIVSSTIPRGHSIDFSLPLSRFFFIIFLSSKVGALLVTGGYVAHIVESNESRCRWKYKARMVFHLKLNVRFAASGIGGLRWRPLNLKLFRVCEHKRSIAFLVVLSHMNETHVGSTLFTYKGAHTRTRTRSTTDGNNKNKIKWAH